MGILVLLSRLFLCFPFGGSMFPIFFQVPGTQMSKESYVQVFMNAVGLVRTVTSTVLSLARANGYTNTAFGFSNYEGLIDKAQEVTPWMQLLTQVQSEMSKQCCGGSSCSWTKSGLQKMNTYMSQAVTDPSNPVLFNIESGNAFTSFFTGPPNCPSPSHGDGYYQNTRTCFAGTGCMEANDKPCYKVLGEQSWIPGPLPTVPPEQQVTVNVTMIKNLSGKCVRHTSKPSLGACSSKSGHELFAVMPNMTNNLSFPDNSAPISSKSAAYCFYGNDGALDIGTGSDCTGWHFHHVTSKDAPKGTWPVQIRKHGLCWTASTSTFDLVLSKCAESAQQIFVLVPAGPA